MRYRDSIFASLLKPISRRAFKAAAARHDADAYAKTFSSWDHLVTLIFAQLSPACSLRGLEAAWNANAHHHYHLGTGRIARSTFADANRRRPLAVFAETFAALSGLAGQRLRREGAAMLRLIDATPIPLNALCGWAQWNGRTHGLKMHVVYDPHADHPQRIAITPSTVNDVEIGRSEPIETGAIYVFDKAYCDYAWWSRIHDAGAVFVTRPKKNARYALIKARRPRQTQGEGFTILADADVRLATQGRSRLGCPIRHITFRRDDGAVMEVITNDRKRPAVEIAALYKTPWAIELLFRWLKQHLRLTRFIGRSENAIRLQILAAMIAYLLLRLAAKMSRSGLPLLRFAELAGQCLFVRKPMTQLHKPPEVNASKPKPKIHPGQMELAYACTSPDSRAPLRGQASTILAMSSTAISQQLSLFNAHYDAYCFLPIHVYDTATGWPAAVVLRPGKTPSGPEVRAHARRLVRRIRRAWPTTTITLRGDGHYARPELMQFCEEAGVHYIFGLSGTRPLLAKVDTAADAVRTRRAVEDANVLRDYCEVPHRARSWSRERRAGARIEATRQGLDVRFVVTDLEHTSPRAVYESLYCARSQAENLIKAHKSHLVSDRTSCRRVAANQVRLVLHTAAYWLLLTMRNAIPAIQDLARASSPLSAWRC